MPPPATPPPSSRPKHLKRDSTHLANPRDLSPSKRMRVAFNDDIDVRILDEWTPRPQDLVQEEVRAAIDGHLRHGDKTAYEQLRMLFAGAAVGEQVRDGEEVRHDDPERPSGALLKQYLVALLRRMGDLKGCPALVYAVLDMNWFGREDMFVKLYVKFVGALGSIIPGYLGQVMEKTVRHFVMLPSSYGRLPGEPVVRKRQMLANLHSVLRYLLQLVPSAADALSDALKSQFPNHRMTDLKGYLAYIRQMFRICSFAPELQSDILTLITERLVKIDVEIQEEIEDLDEEMEEDLVEGTQKQDNYFLDDDTSDSSDAESDMSSDLEETAEERQLKSLKDKTAKLDAGMDFLFRHYTSILRPDNTVHDFDNLLSLFTTFVMPTYRARHVQFLAFHFSQLDSAKSARFVSRLLSIIQTSSSSSSSSMIAAAYLSSYISRGAHLPRFLIRDVTSFLINRIDTLRASYTNIRGPDIGRYAPFYTSVQAILYIFCFRWREMLFDVSSSGSVPDEELDWTTSPHHHCVPGLSDVLTLAIGSQLNPLKVCAQPIVKQFAAIAAHLQFQFVHHKIELNKKVRLSSFRTYGGSTQNDSAVAKRDSALSHKGGEAHHQLDAFFPFDPYHLTRSGRWLEGDYNAWRAPAGLGTRRKDGPDESLRAAVAVAEEDEDEEEIENDDESDEDVNVGFDEDGESDVESESS
ncbi:RNA polymerase I-specific transcription initiation factor rrn3 [Sphaceloma murrayae]|uniref:RNA polymerase I-specific transcription initiation factor rrn3 n=1 Tax=Sphaceloma murrayae TaxID=2082308 RepID=A0A2K1QZE1_9PEZI|nr:RNA polymerase I-specific transcription initiation factor rrn3 [Sphaceloma murrayae]